jgi:hypothetical protein
MQQQLLSSTSQKKALRLREKCVSRGKSFATNSRAHSATVFSRRQLKNHRLSVCNILHTKILSGRGGRSASDEKLGCSHTFAQSRADHGRENFGDSLTLRRNGRHEETFNLLSSADSKVMVLDRRVLVRNVNFFILPAARTVIFFSP